MYQNIRALSELEGSYRSYENFCLVHHARGMKYNCGKIDEDRLCGDDERLHRVNVTEIDGGENLGRPAG